MPDLDTFQACALDSPASLSHVPAVKFNQARPNIGAPFRVCDCADNVMALSGAYADNLNVTRRCQADCEPELMLDGPKAVLELTALFVALVPPVPVHICDLRSTTAWPVATGIGSGDGHTSAVTWLNATPVRRS